MSHKVSSMSEQIQDEQMTPVLVHGGGCEAVREGFSGYLDGAVTGVEMAAISAHLEICGGCAQEFAAWRDVQAALGQMGQAHPPASLQANLRAVLSEEAGRGTHLPLLRRFLLAWQRTLAPMALRVSGGLVAALLLAGGLGWIFGAPIAVQANDDRIANMVAPRYLYSQVPAQPIVTGRDVPVSVPIVVEAKVDTAGRVYDYKILEGPTDPQVVVSIEANLLASVFKPATVFGEPVRGHVVLTYTGVSVHG